MDIRSFIIKQNNKSAFVLKDGRLVDGRIVLDGKHKHVEFSGLCPRVVVSKR